MWQLHPLINFFALFTVLVQVRISASHSDQKLIVILADGFRYDYVQKAPENGSLKRMMAEGVTAQFVHPVFPTKSYPNWYTITTGLYVENHGMVGNNFYDPSTNTSFKSGPHPDSQIRHFWESAEPIWVTAERQGVRTAMFWWDGCNVGVRNTSGTFCADYGPLTQVWTWDQDTYESDYANAANVIMEKFSKNEWQLAMIYFEAIDGAGHLFGTQSDEVRDAIAKLDNLVKVTQEGIAQHRLEDKVNVIVVSDHGMLDVGPSYGTKMIRLSTFLNKEDFKYVGGGGPFVLLWPADHKNVEDVYEELLRNADHGMYVYLKKNIPEKYHFKNSDRISPILLVAKRGYIIELFIEYPYLDCGVHGYDPFEVREMSAGYLASGPAFKKNFKARAFMQIDHYNVFCHVLGLEPAKNNGSYVRVAEFLSSPNEKYARNVVFTSGLHWALAVISLITMFAAV